MITFIVYAAALICLGLFWMVWQIDSGRRVVFTPFLLFGINEVFRNWPPALAASWLGVSETYFAAALMLGAFVLFLGGYVVTTLVLRYRSGRLVRYIETPVGGWSAHQYWLLILLAGSVLFLLGMYLYQGIPPAVSAVASLVRGELTQAVAWGVGSSRESLTKGHYFGGEYRGQGAIRVLMGIGWPFLTAIATILAIKTRQKFWVITASVLGVLAFAFIAGDGTRGPFMWAVIFILVAVSYVSTLRYRHLGYAFVGAVMLLILMSVVSPKLYSAVGTEGFLMTSLSTLGERVLFGNGMFSVWLIELVQNGEWPLRWGTVHAQTFINAIPGAEGGVPLSYELYKYLFPGGTGTTYLSSTYFGQLYLDFGTAGCLTVYFALGALVASVQSALVRMPRTALRVILVAWISLVVGRLPLVGPAPAIAELVVIFVVYYGLAVAGSMFHPESRRAKGQAVPVRPTPSVA